MKRILIIGATSAIATECARIWAKEQSQFFLVARDLQKLSEISADLEARGVSKVCQYAMDATNIDDHKSMLEACISEFHQIDIALIAHGTLPDQQNCERDVELTLKEISSNGTSVIALLTIFAAQFEKQKCGSIAVISSVAGDRGRPSNYVYGAAKAAVSTFCEGLRARMFKVGVSLTTIKPGFVDTPMTKGLNLPPQLLSTPQKVATQIVAAIHRRDNTIYTPKFWSFIMLIIRLVPASIFKRANL